MEEVDRLFAPIIPDAYKQSRVFAEIAPGAATCTADIPGRAFFAASSTFTILPVCSAREYALEHLPPSVVVFGRGHPTGFRFAELDDAMSTLGLPSWYEKSPALPESETTGCNGFAHKITALISNQVGGQAIGSVCPGPGMRIWFVVMKGRNKASRQVLRSARRKSRRTTRDVAIDWYAKRGFGAKIA